jgi:hypothetical protein
VNDSANTWLGIIAVATLLIALVQIGVLVAAGLLARRLGRLANDIERELKPMFEHLNAIGRDAARAAALATAQVERADRLFADLTVRVEQGLISVQQVVSGPAREGAALWSALRAAFKAFRAPRSRRKRSGADDEDALFI